MGVSLVSVTPLPMVHRGFTSWDSTLIEQLVSALRTCAQFLKSRNKTIEVPRGQPEALEVFVEEMDT